MHEQIGGMIGGIYPRFIWRVGLFLLVWDMLTWMNENGSGFGQVLCFFEKRTLEEGARGLLPVPVPKCKEP